MGTEKDIALSEGAAVMGEVPICDGHHEHAETVEFARKALPEAEVLYRLTAFFKVFADNTRMRILYLLTSGEMCVCDIAAAMDMSLSAVSHQLRVLKIADLVRFRRVGKTVFYSLADSHVEKILDQGKEHILE